MSSQQLAFEYSDASGDVDDVVVSDGNVKGHDVTNIVDENWHTTPSKRSEGNTLDTCQPEITLPLRAGRKYGNRYKFRVAGTPMAVGVQTHSKRGLPKSRDLLLCGLRETPHSV